jgi:hypothetical protein
MGKDLRHEWHCRKGSVVAFILSEIFEAVREVSDGEMGRNCRKEVSLDIDSDIVE